MLLGPAPLGGYAGTLGNGHHNGLIQEIGSGVADVGAGHRHLAGLKLHLAGGVADVCNLTVGLDEVAGIHGRLELNVVVGTEQALVAVALDQQLGSHVAEQMHHMGTVHQVSAVVGVLGGHPQTDHRGVLFLFHVDSTPYSYL